MGYHIKKIQKGELGHASKIREEYEEFIDAYEQSNPVMELVELSDLLGAIEAYVINHYDIELDDLIRMKDATKSAFEDGTRSSNYLHPRWKCKRCKYEVDMVAFRCNCKTSPSPWEPIE
jgi:hypothetical protein